ncbi:hypothetical protein [Vitreoscilla sp. C1]|uniref:hypothetical protein n=1 Tax=Vitreoscilla sp. (strain C1) TaxID=96942 RepID=UPI000CDBFC25|nr:hypothetical protein [Vitreoscilla sp. C1]
MTKPPMWPLLLLLVSVPVTVVGMWCYLLDLDESAVYALTAWVAFLFCYAHRLVYFYHVRQAQKWVYFMAMPMVLIMYPALFVCWMCVAAMQAEL